VRERTRILVVDDCRDSAESCAMLLSLDGFATRVCHDADRALGEAVDFVPHVVMLDLALGSRTHDGFSLARLFRRHPRLRGARLFAVTGLGQPAYRTRARQAGFDEFLVKPVEPDELSALIRRHVGGRPADRVAAS
jgi:DNA-binding response OmpR family regulator